MKCEIPFASDSYNTYNAGHNSLVLYVGEKTTTIRFSDNNREVEVSNEDLKKILRLID